ncbi:hypothetical protein DACRYDRAFT_97460 [Dacryopinax primogenitus]|uniref:Integral membrane protein n=1 Tax=Dacryopinax primogenitus (strain DJM 731) TaxID=1858805 RepID=M5FP40_DACPD|nr:uncharacterized protein DACRYDRAFT_97460 [Dacryopinax primogenitus]EJT96798.1 hypothetical protein DACRYDRAFT_97460 [Dacryopinax primogenitus]
MESCTVTMNWTLATTCFVYVAAGLVLSLRTWAIWNRNWYLGIGLGVAWGALTVAAIVFTTYTMVGLTAYGQLPGLPGCGPRVTPEASAASLKIYAIYCSYEGIIFLLTIGRGIQHLSKPSGLMLVLYRDAFLASTCLLTFSLINTILSSSNSPSFYCPYMLSFGFSFIVPCRIILNLRATTTELDDWDVVTTTRQPPNGRIPLGAYPVSDRATISERSTRRTRRHQSRFLETDWSDEEES